MSGLGEAVTTDTSTTATEGVATGLGTAPEQASALDILNNDGTFKEGWTNNLSPDYQEFGKLSNYKDINSLVGSLVNQEKVISKGVEKLPNADSEPEEWDALWGKLGRPESADGYKLNTEELGMELPDDAQSWFKEQMHKMGADNDKANGFLAEYAKFEAEANEALIADAEASYKEESDKYIQEVGQREYEKQLSSADKVLDHFPDLKEMIVSDPALQQNPTLIKALAKVQSWISEDKLTKGTAQMLQQPKDTARDLMEKRSLAIRTGDKAGLEKLNMEQQKLNMQMLNM